MLPSTSIGFDEPRLTHLKIRTHQVRFAKVLFYPCSSVFICGHFFIHNFMKNFISPTFNNIPGNFPKPRTPPRHTQRRKQMHDSENFESEKRNCGRTGPTSPEGRAASSKNSTKHGACARTLILPHESKQEWEDLLAHWCDLYKPAEDSLYYDFVVRTAQAEWHRRRAQVNFEVFMADTGGGSTINWQPEQIKKYDLALRYKTSAERSFQREFRLLEQFYKAHPPQPPPKEEQAKEKEENDDEDPESMGPAVVFTVEDPTSPTGYRVLQRCVPQRPRKTDPLRFDPRPPLKNSS
jgi:hypothetical protein